MVNAYGVAYGANEWGITFSARKARTLARARGADRVYLRTFARRKDAFGYDWPTWARLATVVNLGKLSQTEARAILARCSVEPGSDFHALSSAQVDALLSEADKRDYRKPRSANGSRARYFHAYVERAASSQDR